MTRLPLRLVIFDCDGVLVDSEPASRRALEDEAARLGTVLSEQDATRFHGLRWADVQTLFELSVGQQLPPDWRAQMQTRLVAHMRDNIASMPGAESALRAVAAYGVPYRIASNSSHEEMQAKFASAGLAALVAGRVHSACDVGAGKPSPDLFLATAAAERVPPGACLVIEDSRPGVVAALAAGMGCLAYIPHGDLFGLVDLGARPLRDLADLGGFLRAAAAGRAA